MAARTIVLATDLSCRCDRALDRAALLAAEWHARLVVVHVVQEAAPVTDLPSWRRPPDPLAVARARVLGDLRDASALAVDVVVERGDPAARILDVLDRVGGELVVTGVARDETLGRAIVGTTVESLARRAQVPVLVVKARPRGPYREVVVATDFSEGSRAALEAALARLPAARVSLFHAFDVAYEGLVHDRMAARAAAAERAREACRAFLAATPVAASAGRPIDVLCEYGEPGGLLDDLVHARGVDLVVLGTQGRSGLAHALVGSVAQRLVARLPVDVLVVRRRRS